MKRTPAVDAMVDKFAEKPRLKNGVFAPPLPPTFGQMNPIAPSGAPLAEKRIFVQPSAPNAKSTLTTSRTVIGGKFQTILSLDIGATIGLALIDASAEKVIAHWQQKYGDPTEGSMLLGVLPVPDAVVIEEPRGFRTKTGSGANTWSVVVNARRSERWHNWFMWNRRLPTFWYSDNVSKPEKYRKLRLLLRDKKNWFTDLDAKTKNGAKLKNEHAIDAAWCGLAWVRANKAKGAGK